MSENDSEKKKNRKKKKSITTYIPCCYLTRVSRQWEKNYNLSIVGYVYIDEKEKGTN